MYNTLFIMA